VLEQRVAGELEHPRRQLGGVHADQQGGQAAAGGVVEGGPEAGVQVAADLRHRHEAVGGHPAVDHEHPGRHGCAAHGVEGVGEGGGRDLRRLLGRQRRGSAGS
jgi:hypothetical protein